jgi:hypothetical protein
MFAKLVVGARDGSTHSRTRTPPLELGSELLARELLWAYVARALWSGYRIEVRHRARGWGNGCMTEGNRCMTE